MSDQPQPSEAPGDQLPPRPIPPQPDNDDDDGIGDDHGDGEE